MTIILSLSLSLCVYIPVLACLFLKVIYLFIFLSIPFLVQSSSAAVSVKWQIHQRWQFPWRCIPQVFKPPYIHCIRQVAQIAGFYYGKIADTECQTSPGISLPVSSDLTRFPDKQLCNCLSDLHTIALIKPRKCTKVHWNMNLQLIFFLRISSRDFKHAYYQPNKNICASDRSH